jgi:hypothetical protein
LACLNNLKRNDFMCKRIGSEENVVNEQVPLNSANSSGNGQGPVSEQDQKIQNCLNIQQHGGVQVMGLGPVNAKQITQDDIQNAESQNVEVKKSHVKRNLLIVAGVLLLIGAALVAGGVAALAAGAAVAIYAPLMAVGGAFVFAGAVTGIVGLSLQNKHKNRFVHE